MLDINTSRRYTYRKIEKDRYSNDLFREHRNLIAIHHNYLFNLRRIYFIVRYFIISDIHSNLEALQVVLSDMHTVSQFNKDHDRFICLGDIVGYATNPNECMDIVYKYSNVIVKGNHDQGTHWTIKGEKGEYIEEHYNALAQAGLNYSAEVLLSQNKERLAELVTGDYFVQEENDILFTHSQPRYPANMEIYIENMQDAMSCFFTASEFAGKTAFIGHRHIPQVYQRRPSGSTFQPAIDEGGEVNFLLKGRSLRKSAEPWLRCIQEHAGKPLEKRINLSTATMALVQVPSVGQPRDDCEYTGYALYDSNTKEITLRRLPYNLELTQKKICAAGLPSRIASRLQLGN